ncbi:twin-arginine translocation signal domain-containing protein [Cupriavidus nantongensis]
MRLTRRSALSRSGAGAACMGLPVC